MIRIMHSADLHLGMKFSAYPEVREELSAARFATLESIVAIANSERCTDSCHCG